MNSDSDDIKILRTEPPSLLQFQQELEDIARILRKLEKFLDKCEDIQIPSFLLKTPLRRK